MKKILVLVLCFAAFFANAESIEKNFNVNSVENVEAVSFNSNNLFQQDTIQSESSIVEKIVAQTKEEVVKPETSKIIPSQGLSINSIWRGILGMISLLVIAFLYFSGNTFSSKFGTH